MTNYRNRGMFLEKLINISNKQYRERELAVIHKIPTPTSVNTVKGTARYTEKSTVDFEGVTNGVHVSFDAKECKAKSFAFSRLQPHQEKHLIDIYKQKGDAFILILFTSVNELYRINIDEYMLLKKRYLENNRKSIPYTWFKEHKRPIKSKNGIYYDYLNKAHYVKGGGY